MRKVLNELKGIGSFLFSDDGPGTLAAVTLIGGAIFTAPMVSEAYSKNQEETRIHSLARKVHPEIRKRFDFNNNGSLSTYESRCMLYYLAKNDEQD